MAVQGKLVGSVLEKSCNLFKVSELRFIARLANAKKQETGFCLSCGSELARMVFLYIFTYKKKATHALSRFIADSLGQF